MIPYRKLSIALTDLLAEAQALVDLKTKFGRLPNSAVKTAALEEIDGWFNVTGDGSLVRKPNQTSTHHDLTGTDDSSQEVGFLSLTDKAAMADNVPDDDDIPF